MEWTEDTNTKRKIAIIWKKRQSDHVKCHHPTTPNSVKYPLSPTLGISLSTLKLKIILFNQRTYIIVLFQKKTKTKTQQKPYSWLQSQASLVTTDFNPMRWGPQEMVFAHQWAGRRAGCPKIQESGCLAKAAFPPVPRPLTHTNSHFSSEPSQ